MLHVTTAVSSLLNSVAKDQRKRNGLHRGLRCSQHKNRLFRKLMQTQSPHMKQNIKKYRGYYKKLLDDAEKSCFTDILMSKPILSNSSGRIWLQLCQT